VDAFGEERDWSEIPYPEAKALARIAIDRSLEAPLEYICDVFKLKRRHEKTSEKFQSWINDVSQN